MRSDLRRHYLKKKRQSSEDSSWIQNVENKIGETQCRQGKRIGVSFITKITFSSVSILVPYRLSVSSVLTNLVSLPRVSRRHVTERYPLFSTVVSSRLVTIGADRFSSFPSFSLFLTGIARSPDYNNRIQSCSTYWEERVLKVNSGPIATDCDYLKKRAWGVVVARLFYETHTGRIHPCLPPSPCHLATRDSANSISLTLLFIFFFLLLSFTIYYVYFIRYIVTRYRLLSLLLRLL